MAGARPRSTSSSNTAAVLPYYLYLAATGAFFENHCSAFGTNSTPNHMAIVGGPSPTLRNPPRGGAPPVWDLPSLPGLAAAHQLAWKCYAGSSGYPFHFYKELTGSANIVRSASFHNGCAGRKAARAGVSVPRQPAGRAPACQRHPRA